MPTAKSLAPESKEDELSSSDEVVNKEFDKKEFLLGFQEKMAAAISAAMSEVILKLLERPTKNRGEKQHRKNLREKEAKHLTDDTGTGSAIMRSRTTSHQSGNTDNVIHQLVRSDSESSERVQRKIGTEAEHWAAVEKMLHNRNIEQFRLTKSSLKWNCSMPTCREKNLKRFRQPLSERER